MEKKLENYLEKHKINYILHKHKAVFSVEESRELKKEIPGFHCKCLFLRDSNGVFYLVGMPAEKRLDVKKFRKHFGMQKLHFGSADELKEKLGLTPGSVSIFGMINDDKKDVVLVIDKNVWDAGITGFHPNHNEATLEIKHDDLERFYKSLNCRKEIIEL